MRVLHVTDSYHPVIGGLERSVRTLAITQSGRGHQVAVLTAAHPAAQPTEDDNGVQVVREDLATQRLPGALADPARPFHATIADPMFSRAVTKLLRTFRPHVVHCHGWSLYSALGPANKLGVPVVMTNHDYSHLCARKTLLRDGRPCPGPALDRCLPCAGKHYGLKGPPLALGLHLSSRRHPQVAQWTGVSTAIAAAGSATYQRHATPMTVIPSYVPDDVLSKGAGKPRPAFVPAHGPYLLFVGALGPHKGLGVLLDAHKRLESEHGLQVPLVCIGTPRHDTPSMNRPHVTVAHNIPHDTVMAAWRHAEIGVIPSLSEAFGQVAVEALAAGTALIASHTGGLPDIITHEKTGLLVPPGDAALLATAIARLLNEPDLRQSLANAGPARARQFTVSHVAEQFDAVYRDVMDRRGFTN